ncbi:effector-associated domain EAD1-containing protein [Nonomuraea africana]|uniref:CHAT domain-containing protein n=1 Tax=Nonomuraea africana TaxID=46171 RepID=A0ABR9KFI5_9ACTN|nr:effector-associated domain EAD1-containing protein [Nonomuraea africana]MBE1560740.1 hypothetical protein [Nonomuraea africana]
MLRASAFDTLGELYPDDDSCHLLLASLGANRARLPVRGARRPRDFWMAVCQEVEKGAFAFTLDDLVARAAADYPGNRALRELAPGRPAREHAGPAGQELLRVLCLMASPGDQGMLNLAEELRRIQLVAERSGRMEVSARTAARTSDILPALLTVRPHVVHFAGHGDDDGALVFEDTAHVSTRVAAERLAAAFEAAGPLLCVVLNACYTGEQAEVFLAAAGAVAGSTEALPDQAAILFSEGFYLGLGDGRSAREAFGLGSARMGLDGHDTSCLRYLDREGEL